MFRVSVQRLLLCFIALCIQKSTQSFAFECDSSGWSSIKLKNETHPFCVKLFEEKKTFLEAVKYCRLQNNSELATILSEELQTKIHSLNKTKGKFWIGLNDHDVEKTFKWVSGYGAVSTVFWVEGQSSNHFEHLNKDCVAINGDKPPLASWSEEECIERLPFLCMKATFPGVPKGIDLESKSGNCPAKYFRLGNRCFRIITDKPANFTNARKECQKHDGDLASIYSVKEQNIMTSLMRSNESNDVWIGLQLRKKSYEYRWVRGLYPTVFTNWKQNEPNGGISERCTMMYARMSSPGEWNDKNCDFKLPYICEVNLLPNGTGVANVDPLFDKGKNCSDGEVEYDDFCYKSPDGNFSSFDDAEKACQDFHENGHLVAPNNGYEAAFTNAFMDRLNITKTLLGYRINESESDYDIIATDKDDNVGFDSLKGIMWPDVKPLSCILSTGNPRNYVSVTNCTQKTNFSAICRYPLKKSVHHPDNRNFTCEKGWGKISFGRCIKLFDPKKTFFHAAQTCKDKGAVLVSILNAHDQQHATELAKKASSGVWIGLELSFDLNGKEFIPRWSDGNRVTFLHWRAGEPTATSRSGNEEKCVVMRQSSFEWNNVVCTKERSFLCSKPGTPGLPEVKTTPKSPTPTKPAKVTSKPTAKPAPKPTQKTTPKPTPKPTQKPTPKPTQKPKPSGPTCPKDFDNNQYQYCYKVIPSAKKTWHQAERYCNSLSGSNLVSIHDMQENKFVEQLMAKSGVKTGLWIGLSDLYGPAENQFNYWSDNSSISFTILNLNGSEKSYFGNEDCVVMTPGGGWITKHCTTTAGFICKWQDPKNKKNQPILPPVQTPGQYCEQGFVKFKKSCYKLITKPANFKTAESECKKMFPTLYQKNVQLARVSTLEENDFLLSLLGPIKNKAAWMGLYYKDGKYHWTDNWPVHFTRWPNNVTFTDLNSSCVALGASTITILTGMWYVRSCRDRLPYICQTPLIGQSPQKSKLRCHDSYQLYEDGKTCYRRLDEPMTFEDGKKKCEEDKGLLNLASPTSLLTLNSVFEMSFFTAWMISSRGPIDRSVWLGLKLEKKAVWKWINGETVGFTYTSGLPDDVSGCYFIYIHNKIVKGGHSNEYGMHPDPMCGVKTKRTVVCKYSLDSVPVTRKEKECLTSKEGLSYAGTQAVAASGNACIRWDLITNIHLVVQLSYNVGGSDSNFCRNPKGKLNQRDKPFCYTRRGSSAKNSKWEYCDIPLCASVTAHAGGHGYVMAVVILIIVLLVTIIFFVGVMLWRRTNTARGFIPYLRQHDPEGGTSFHNPIYTPAAEC